MQKNKTLVKALLACLLMAGFFSMANAQEKRFFVPSEIKNAYKSGTRSMDGKPGPKYWQNTADYQIKVKVVPGTRLLDGSETVTYYNKSPKDLNTIVVRLYFDVFRKANPRASRVRPDDISDEGVKLKELSINGEAVNLKSRQVNRSGTNLYIRLKKPLKSGEKVTMKTAWEQYIPLTNRRTGAADKTSFFVAYWYPQIAVYDDVFGWDTENYSLRTEFYNGLANFDVTIDAPKNYTVWATGVLQNPDKVFTDKTLKQYNEALKSSKTVDIIKPEDLDKFEHKAGSWQFKAQEVSDFAFALSDHYAWTAAVQKVDNRQVLVSSAFPKEKAKNYAKYTEVQQKIMKHFSEDVPGIPYPYPRFTSFIGLRGGGMEFPMMAYNQDQGTGLATHEMHHTYFPMYVRINERRFAWMDEGWADYITTVVMNRFMRKEKDNGPFFGKYKSSVQGTVGSFVDLPLITSTQFMDGSNYGYASYPLPAFIYSILHHHLGDKMFLKAFREYIRRWAKKSPTPYDFFYTFEDVSKQDLGWLWTPWFFRQGNVDVAIKSMKGSQLTIFNKGNRPVPVQVNVTYKDGKTEKIYQSASIWKTPGDKKIKIPNAKQVAKLSVNSNVVDGDIMDNFYPSLIDQLKAMKIDKSIFGDYAIARYGFTMSVINKNGLIFMDVPAANTSSYLMPHKDGSYRSLDEQMVFKFEGGSVKGELKQFGVKISGKKKKE
ncbi:MAG TPA: hypothetical protein DCS93_03095 [Microscillaceae bacterium]|nr:hypothetical protein [Microscillaceae bacterium]